MIVDLATERGRITLSELAQELESDSGTLFVAAESLIAEGELVKINHFTYGPPNGEAVDGDPEPTGPESPSVAEQESRAGDRADSERPEPGPGQAQDAAEASEPSSARVDSRWKRAAGGTLVFVGVLTAIVGLVGLYLVLVGGFSRALAYELAGGLVGGLTPTMAAAGTGGLVVLGGVVGLLGWVVFRRGTGANR